MGLYYDQRLAEAAKSAACLIVVEHQLGRGTNHHKTPANKPTLTGAGLSLDQVKGTKKSLPAFIIVLNTGQSGQK